MSRESQIHIVGTASEKRTFRAIAKQQGYGSLSEFARRAMHAFGSGDVLILEPETKKKLEKKAQEKGMTLHEWLITLAVE